MKKRRRSYLLFEVLMAMALLLVCLFPLVRAHTGMGQLSKQRLQKQEMRAAAHLAFLEIKAHLYQHDYTWQQLRKGVSGETQCGPYTLALRESTHKRSTGRKYLLLDADLMIGDATFTQTFLVEQRPAA